MEHNFTGPSYAIGIEEELMICDGSTFDLANAIESLLGPVPAGQVKPELMESVLEIATDPEPDTARAGAQLRALRAHVRATAARRDLTIGSSGTHPFAMWEDQRIAARERYRDLVSSLRFVARQELIFGVHVHVALDDPDKAIHVADGMRVHLGELVDLPGHERIPTRDLARRLVERLRDHAQDLGSAAELEAVEDLIERGTGADRQLVVYDASATGRRGTYAVVVGNRFRVVSNAEPQSTAAAESRAALNAHRNDGVAAVLEDFVKRTNQQGVQGDGGGGFGGGDFGGGGGDFGGGDF